MSKFSGSFGFLEPLVYCVCRTLTKAEDCAGEKVKVEIPLASVLSISEICNAWEVPLSPRTAQPMGIPACAAGWSRP